jgi:hypothetical protein
MNSATVHVDPAVSFTWFPLIMRPRPPGLPLETRIAELTSLADGPSDGPGHDRASRAAEVFNKAALIASDCALPDLARDLCHRQHAVFAQAGPLPEWAVKLSLQPILNIARQLIREGDGDGAYTMLAALYKAARRARRTVIVDGRLVELSALTRTPDDHKTVCTLIWAALLADGTRALALAGRWGEAADSAAAHRGVGNRLLDGRQASILALLHKGEVNQAAATVEQSTIVEPWEHAVQSLLRVLCLRAEGNDTAHHRATMLTASRALAQEQNLSTTVPRTRAAIIALELGAICDDAQLQPLCTATITAASQDAYAARDAVAHPQVRAILTAQQRYDLNELVRACGLGAGTLAPALYRQMIAAVECAETVLADALRRGQ